MSYLLTCLSAPSTDWILQAPADDFWEWATLLSVASIGGFIGAFYFFLRKRIVEDTPTSNIRSAAQGYVELSGISKLMDGSIITGPLTSTTCAWYSYSIEEHQSSGKNSHWVTLEEGISDNLFLIIDDTGEAVIDPENANVTPGYTDVWYGSTRQPQHRSAARRKKKFFNISMGDYRYTEMRIHPDEKLYAIGLFATVGGTASEYNTSNDVAHLLRKWKKNSEHLLARFDENKDGQIDMEEWQKVRETALKQINSQHADQKASAPVHILGKTCDSRRPFLLSALPQSDLVKRYSRYATGMIIIFFVAGALATWMISVRLSV
ncbi:MAG: GIDE domain-containing protein [Gammaproteobacteria bacterium]